MYSDHRCSQSTQEHFGKNMSTNHLWPLCSACWSLVTSMSGHSVNILAFSSDQATPSASSSTGAYQDLAPEHFLLPAKTICQPSLQLHGALSRLQEHFFCVTMNPIPSLLQSVDRQVIFLMLQVFTPFSTLLTISSFAFLTSCFSSSVHFHVFTLGHCR